MNALAWRVLDWLAHGVPFPGRLRRRICLRRLAMGLEDHYTAFYGERTLRTAA